MKFGTFVWNDSVITAEIISANCFVMPRTLNKVGNRLLKWVTFHIDSVLDSVNYYETDCTANCRVVITDEINLSLPIEIDCFDVTFDSQKQTILFYILVQA